MMNRFKIFFVLLLWSAFSFAGTATAINTTISEVEEVEEFENSEEEKDLDFISACSNHHKSLAADGGKEEANLATELILEVPALSDCLPVNEVFLSHKAFHSEPLFILYCSLKICA